MKLYYNLKRYFWAFTFFLPLVCSAQTSEIDSLFQAVEKTTSDSVRVDLLATISKLYYSLDGKKAISNGEKSLGLAQKIQYKKGEAQALNNIGGAYFMLGDFPKAAGYHFKALKIRESIKDSTGLCASFVNLGNVYNYKQDTAQALSFYKKALVISTQIKNKKFMSMVLNNIGHLYERTLHPDKALTYYKQSLPIKREIGDVTGIAISLNNIGDIYQDKKLYKQSLVFLNEALKISTENNDNLNKCYALRGISLAYNALNINSDLALNYARQSFVLAKQLGSKEEIKESAGVLQEVYLNRGDYKNALESYNLFRIYNDSILTETGQREVAEMQVKYETEKKSNENIRLRAEKTIQAKELERKNIRFWFIIFACLAFAAFALITFLSQIRIKRINEALVSSFERLKQQKEEISLQAQLLVTQKEELEKMNELKTKFFSIISHAGNNAVTSRKTRCVGLSAKAVL